MVTGETAQRVQINSPKEKALLWELFKAWLSFLFSRHFLTRFSHGFSGVELISVPVLQLLTLRLTTKWAAVTLEGWELGAEGGQHGKALGSLSNK